MPYSGPCDLGGIKLTAVYILAIYILDTLLNNHSEVGKNSINEKKKKKKSIKQKTNKIIFSTSKNRKHKQWGSFTSKITKRVKILLFAKRVRIRSDSRSFPIYYDLILVIDTTSFPNLFLGYKYWLTVVI